MGAKNTVRLKQLWSELKRRHVHRTLAIYAGSAFVFLEATTIIFPRWGFPDWTIDLVLCLLILGAFITIAVAWIFDITPQGVQITKPADEVPETDKAKDSNAWKIATFISFAVILALLTYNIVGGTKKLHAGDIQSLVILPFENFTGADSLEYYVSGMHSTLIMDIGKIGSLLIPGTTTSKTFKNSNKTLAQITSEVNVDAALETSIVCLGKDTVCLQTRLIKPGKKEQQVWIADYKVERSQILNLFNTISKQIADELLIELTPEEERLLAKSRTVDREALDEYLRARAYGDDFNRESIFKARDYLNSALEKEPEWAPLYVGLATVWLYIQQIGFEPPSIASPKIYEYLNKAIELDPDISDSYYLSGIIAHVMEWDWEKSEKEYLKALAINPNDALSRIFYAQLLCILHMNDEAAEQGKIAMKLDPLNPMMKVWYGSLLIGLGDCETPLAYGEEIVAADPQSYFGNNIIEGAAYRCKEYDKVIQAVRYCLPFPIEDDTFNEVERIYKENGLASAYELIVKELEDFASEYPISFIDMSLRYIIANQPEKAMDWVEKGYELHDPQMTYIFTYMYHLDPLFTNPRFIEIAQEMNLQLPKSKEKYPHE